MKSVVIKKRSVADFRNFLEKEGIIIDLPNRLSELQILFKQRLNFFGYRGVKNVDIEKVLDIEEAAFISDEEWDVLEQEARAFFPKTFVL